MGYVTITAQERFESFNHQQLIDANIAVDRSRDLEPHLETT